MWLFHSFKFAQRYLFLLFLFSAFLPSGLSRGCRALLGLRRYQPSAERCREGVTPGPHGGVGVSSPSPRPHPGIKRGVELRCTRRAINPNELASLHCAAWELPWYWFYTSNSFLFVLDVSFPVVVVFIYVRPWRYLLVTPQPKIFFVIIIISHSHV